MLKLAGGFALGVPLALILAISGGERPADCLPAGSEATATQLDNARLIVAVAEQLGVPSRGRIIALATALVESELENVAYGDRDSVGLFQQRPSQGWGTPGQLLDPTYSATAFYERLVATPQWLVAPPGDIAQAVQRSAYPERYGQRMAEAAAIHDVVTGAGAGAGADSAGITGGCSPSATGELVGVATPAGGTITVDGSITSPLTALLDAAAADGIILGGWGWRSTERQAELRSTNGCPDTFTAPASSCRIPTARPGSSLHESGLAVDFTCNGGGIVRRGDPCDAWLLANAGTFGLRNLPSEAWHYSPSGG
jgi:hypothetical protein